MGSRPLSEMPQWFRDLPIQSRRTPFKQPNENWRKRWEQNHHSPERFNRSLRHHHHHMFKTDAICVWKTLPSAVLSSHAIELGYACMTLPSFLLERLFESRASTLESSCNLFLYAAVPSLEIINPIRTTFPSLQQQ